MEIASKTGYKEAQKQLGLRYYLENNPEGAYYRHLKMNKIISQWDLAVLYKKQGTRENQIQWLKYLVHRDNFRAKYKLAKYTTDPELYIQWCDPIIVDVQLIDIGHNICQSGNYKMLRMLRLAPHPTPNVIYLYSGY